MVLRWIPDTCNCVLILNAECTEMLDWEKKCAEHKKISDDKLFAAVKLENKKFGFEDNYMYTDDEVDEKAKLKQEAKIKNKKKGKIEINKKINKSK